MIALVAVTAVGSALAQSQRGAIVGTVADASGAIVPNAKIELTHDDTKFSQQPDTEE